MRIVAVLLAASLAACAAGADPEPFSIASALDGENELEALDIGTDEPVVEEGEELDDLVDPSLDGAEENPVADDPADAPRPDLPRTLGLQPAHRGGEARGG